MNVAIVAAAGKGTRLGGIRPKQFLEIGGVPIIIHTLKQFERSREINEVIAVLPSEEVAGFSVLARQHGLAKLLRAVAGGQTRAQSVLCGLVSISDAEIVAVHDGARPFVTSAEIDATVAAARADGAAILGTGVGDTIKEIRQGRVLGTLSRANLRRALTPQCFRFEILKRAYEGLSEIENSGIEVTDDSMLVEALGLRVTVVEGSPRNIKITSTEDLALAEALLRGK